MKKYLLFLFFSIIAFPQNISTVDIKKRQDSLINEFLTNGAERYNYNYEMKEWQECLDEGLQKDSTVARLWQEKAMPYFKVKKYEVGMTYVDKAVLYDPAEYLPYRAFIRCIFSKEYKKSIIDFEEAKKIYGNNYVMDHPYTFYIALCYLQLNEYEKAEKLLQEYVDGVKKNKGEEWVSPTALFYLGIAKYEHQRWDNAIFEFDRALLLYKNFSDAKYYKAICIAKLRRNQNEMKELIKQWEEDGKKGYTIPEYNTVYETYPYQRKPN